MQSEYIKTYVGIGSNLGDRTANLLLAVRGLLEASLYVTRLSAIYETEPHGVFALEHPPYLNMAAEVHVKNVSPEQMMARMLRIEYLLGRRQKFQIAPRTVDLDLLIFGDRQINSPLLTVPHPRLHERNFVLVPLNEIAPTLVHPILKKEIRELLQNSPDDSKVARFADRASAPNV